MNTIDLFGKINEINGLANGWCHPKKAMAMAGLVLATRPSLAVEIGSYSGKSVLPVALSMQLLGHGTIIAIDPYSPDESAKDESEAGAVWWKNLDHNAILAEFQGHIQKYSLQNIVQVHRMTSDAFDPSNLKIDMLHIDGHHAHALTDAKRYCPNVVSGGYVFMDDLHWYVDNRFTVKDATDWMEQNRFTKLYDSVRQYGSATTPDEDWGLYRKL